MKTYKLKHSGLDITEWCKSYSYMYRKLYANFELSEDKNFQKELRERWNLDSWFFESCLIEVSMKIKQNVTQRKNKLSKIEELQKILLKDEFETGKKGRRTKFNIAKSLQYLTTHIDKDITFGTKALLQKITYLHNYVNGLKASLLKEQDPKEKQNIERKLAKAELDLSTKKAEYQNNRTLAIISVGEAPQKSNRKFDFDFVNKKMVFKPESGIKYPFEFYCSKAQYKDLCELQKQIGEQAITVRLDNEYVYIAFDNEKLNGFAFNEREFKREIKAIPKENKEERTACSRKWKQEQDARKFAGKNQKRFLAVDLNPEYIGYSILEKVGDSGFKTILNECISLTDLNTKLSLSSEDKLQVYQNNKRIHEIYEAWKKIFGIAERYKVSHFAQEDLEFKQKGVNENSNEANRKTKNIWHRTITTTVIQKYCQEMGIKHLSLNAAYSSFIGNIKHKLFDPVSASIEIGRRGITKYLKGNYFYPPLEGTDLDTMRQFGLDVLDKTISNWKEAYSAFKTSGLRYRWENLFSSESNLKSHKSCVKVYSYKYAYSYNVI